MVGTLTQEFWTRFSDFPMISNEHDIISNLIMLIHFMVLFFGEKVKFQCIENNKIL